MTVTGCHSTNNSERTLHGKFEDSHLRRQVEGALEKDQVYKYSEVKVQVYDGVVQLSGFADTGDEKARAAQVAREQGGVRQVVNNIVLESKITGH